MTEADIAFREFPQKGINQDYTYHVDRSKFDLLLLKHAEALGSKVYQGVPVKEILFEDGRATGVKVGIGGKEVSLQAKVVADASGRDTLLGRQLKLVKKDPMFDQYAVHAWFEGVDKSAATGDYIHIYFLPVERGWAWQIPITEELTSMGIVAEREIFRKSNMDVEAYFDAYVQSNPSLSHAMRNARRVNDFKREADYSYSMRSYCGDGFVLLGDAARFVDPIFSSGVSVAMHSAKFASEVITKAIATGDFSAATFRPYETKLRGGVEIWYEFIRLYYKLLPLVHALYSIAQTPPRPPATAARRCLRPRLGAQGARGYAGIHRRGRAVGVTYVEEGPGGNCDRLTPASDPTIALAADVGKLWSHPDNCSTVGAGVSTETARLPEDSAARAQPPRISHSSQGWLNWSQRRPFTAATLALAHISTLLLLLL